MTEEPERAAAGRASARGEKDERERDLNFSDGTLELISKPPTERDGQDARRARRADERAISR